MARTEQQLASLRVKFRLRVPAGPVTDTSIRAAFFEQVARGRKVLALCEPRETEITFHPGGRRSARPETTIIRRLPLLWRIPHWVMAKELPPLTQEDSAFFEEPERKRRTLWTYPMATTSGNFIRGIVLPMLGPQPWVLEELPIDFGEEGAKIHERLQHDDVFATFTPWHSTPLIERLHLPPAYMFTGPSRDVTAIQTPDMPETTGIVDALAAQLRSVLSELSDSQGQLDRVARLVLENWPTLEAYLRRQGDLLPGWMEADMLSSFLTEYVRLGCYFPYRSMDSAISPEVQKRMVDIFDEVKLHAKESIQTSMSNFFGGAPKWRELVDHERLHVWLANDSTRDLPVYARITHGGQAHRGRPTAEILDEIRVRVSPTSPYVSLLGVAAGTPTDCVLDHSRDDPNQRYECFKSTSQTGVANAGDRGEGHCAACMLAGLPVATLRSAALKLSRGLNLSVQFILEQEGRTPAPCPLCYADVEELVELFIDEAGSRRGDDDRCAVVLFNGFNTHATAATDSIIFGIWWTGDTSKGGGSGHAGQTMQQWRRRRAGPSPSWVGGWWRRENRTVEIDARDWVARGVEEASELRPEGSLFDAARDHFVKSGASFGYVVAFTASVQATPIQERGRL
jgi:hypothetical protein